MPLYTMKQKLSVTIEEGLLETLDMLVESKRFRNKSHAVEYCLQKLIEGDF